MASSFCATASVSLSPRLLWGATIGTQKASNRWPWLGIVSQRAPYHSYLLIIAVGLYVGILGWMGLTADVGAKPGPTLPNAQL